MEHYGSGMAGTLLTEVAFVRWLGVTGTGIAACLFNLLVAVAAVMLARGLLGKGRQIADESTPLSGLSKLSASG